jgi:hypothetical protein
VRWAGGQISGFFRRQCLPFPGQRLWRLRKPGETDARDRCYLIWSKNIECVKYLETLNTARGGGVTRPPGRAETAAP